MSLKTQLSDDMKAAMKSGAKDRLLVIRLIMAGIKQREIDERIELDDTQVLSVMEKMLKQRRDSIAQFGAANRQDLVDIEEAEVAVIQTYMPDALSDDDITAIIAAAIASTGASDAKDMGKVVGAVKPQVAGRADMGKVSQQIKAALAG